MLVCYTTLAVPKPKEAKKLAILRSWYATVRQGTRDYYIDA